MGGWLDERVGCERMAQVGGLGWMRAVCVDGWKDEWVGRWVDE